MQARRRARTILARSASACALAAGLLLHACGPDGSSSSDGPAAAITAGAAHEPAPVTEPAPLEEPRLREEGPLSIWTWQAPDGDYEVRVSDPPWFTDGGDAIQWLHPGQDFLIERSSPAGTTSVHVCGEDSGKPRLSGHIAPSPAEATPEALARELATLLPPVIAHLGLEVERLEVDASHGRLERALDQVEPLTSSTAKLAAYEVVVRELDEPTNAQLNQLLRHAAQHLDGDWFMHELLVEVLSLSFDERLLVTATLDAAASIGSDDLCADALRCLLDMSDEPSPATCARVLAFATRELESDAELALLVRELMWHSLESPAGRQALDGALAALDADGPLRDVLADLFEFGTDCSAVELIAGLQAARTRIDSPDLRASALAALPVATLRDSEVLCAWEETAASIDASDALADLLVATFTQPEADAAVVAAVLRVQHVALAHDFRTSRLLRAVPLATLADPQVARLYREAAESLSSPQERAEFLQCLQRAEPAAAR